VIYFPHSAKAEQEGQNENNSRNWFVAGNCRGRFRAIQQQSLRDRL
jgi:hypothetical protein